MFDKRHQLGFGDFTEMAPKSTEQLTFRKHERST